MKLHRGGCKSLLYIILSCFFSALVSVASAQRIYRGVIADSLTHMPIPGANAVLFSSDTSFIRGVSADTSGVFRISVPSRSRSLMRISCTGYLQKYVAVPSPGKKSVTTMDTIFLSLREVALTEAVVKASRGEMRSEEDTTSFNAEEYHVPEGEALEELIKLLPGVEVDGNTITYNGKVISDFKINGKDFFKGKKGIAMKNLPVELVKRIKTYEKKSDYTEQTGIDDGNEQTVMDIELKKELNETWITSYDAAAGTEGRYLQKAFANRMTDRSRITFTGNMNDNDARSNNKSIGADFNFNNGKDRKENGRFEIGGRVHASNDHSHSSSWRNAESYTGAKQASQFSVSDSYNKNRSSSFGFGLRTEWHPDTLTTVIANMDGNRNSSIGYSSSLSARFSEDPYFYDAITSPLERIFESDTATKIEDSLFYRSAINRNANSNMNRSGTTSFSASAMFVRRLNRKGRNVEADLSAGTSDGRGRSWRLSDIYYFRRAENERRVLQDQYTVSPSHSWRYSGRVSYTEPLLKGLNINTGISASRSRNRGDHSLYELDSLSSWQYSIHEFGDIPDSQDSLDAVLNFRNSHYSTNNDYAYSGNLTMSYNSKIMNARIGCNATYDITRLDYRRAAVDTTLRRELLRFRPNAFFRYRFSRNEKVEMHYQGWNNDPSMTYRIPTVDNSDALNIHITGVNLKPAWQNRVTLSYNRFMPKTQRSVDMNASFTQSSNDISNAVRYDGETGVRITEPRNINGNWSSQTDVTFSSPLPFIKGLRFNCSTGFNYDNSVGRFAADNKSSSVKNTTRTSRVNVRVNLRYHSDIVDARLGSRVRYRHSDNKLRPSSNLDTWDCAYSAEARLQLPWRMTVENELSLRTRRGYSVSSMDTSEFVWDASVSQRFFRGSPLILRLQLNDILHQRSNISRNISAMGRSDTETDASYSYAMLHLILRLNIFNGRISSGFSHRRADNGGNSPKSGRERPKNSINPLSVQK